MVSTDDEEIASIARQYGAKTPFRRSEKNSDDFAGTSDVILEVLESYAIVGQNFTLGCCIYPIAPLLRVETIRDAFLHLERNPELETVFPVQRFHSPIQRALKRSEEGLVSMFHPENLNSRSQDLEPAYFDAGQFYAFRVEAFLKKRKLWTEQSYGIPIPDMDAQDVDTLEDWELMEFKFRYRQ